MKRLILIIYVVLVVVLAVATFVEQARGTAFVGEHVYHTAWFCTLWGVLAALMLVACLRLRLWRRVPLLLLHGSFLVILGGAFLTFMGGQQGGVHLEEGQATDRFMLRDSGELLPLPFTLRLDSFRVQCYPGTDAPEDYISYVRLSVPSGGERAATVSMNRILTCEGYRFYQSSYDPDGRGSWLSVNHDPWGIGVTYAGYALLGLSMLWVLLGRGGEFRRLLRHPLLRKGGFLAVFLLLGTGVSVQAQGRKLPVLKQRQADSLAAVQVIYHDRVTPFNTLARDFVLKLTGRPTYKGLTPEQVVGGWLLHPEVWKDEPMICIKSAALRRRLGLEGDFARLSDLFDGQTYRLQAYWDASAGKAGDKLSPLEKAIVETDEKVGLILMLQNGTLIRPLPTDGSVAPLSDAKVRAELLYNRIPFSQVLFMFNLTMGLLAFGLLLYKGMRRIPPAGRAFRAMERVFTCALWAALLFQAAGYALRWYIGGRIPLGNGYETMQFLALATLLLSGLFRRRFPFTLPFGFLLSGFALLVSWLGQVNPQITPLMPVLVSPWLSSHVSLIMMSYALFAFMMLNGVLALCLRREALRLMLLSRLMLYPAAFFLGAGIFLGAIWANVSWGHYWAWDPKEVWALVTFMVYGVAFHARSLRCFRRPVFFHVYMIAAFLTVLMTYFGVNYVLGGMHSYAG